MEIVSGSPSPQTGAPSAAASLRSEGQVMSLRQEAGYHWATLKTSQGQVEIAIPPTLAQSLVKGQTLAIEAQAKGPTEQLTWKMVEPQFGNAFADTSVNTGMTGARVDGSIDALSQFRLDLVKWLQGQGDGTGQNRAGVLPKDLQLSLADFLAQTSPAGLRSALAGAGQNHSGSDLSKEGLETLLLKTLLTSGGESKALVALRQLPPAIAHGLVKSALASLANASESAMGQAATLSDVQQGKETSTKEFLQLLLRSLDSGSTPDLRKVASAEWTRPMTGMARVVQREYTGDLETGMDFTRNLSSVANGSPLLRLQLWNTGRSLPMLAPESPLVGHPVQFTYADATGMRGEVASLAPKQGLVLTPELEADYGLASPERRLSLAAAQEMLADIESTPFYARAVRDFATVLEATGWMRIPDSSASQPFQPASKSELESLLKVWLETDRPDDANSRNRDPLASTQLQALARSWGEAIRNPDATLRVLKHFMPSDGEGANPSKAGFLNLQTLLKPAHEEAHALLRNALAEASASRTEPGLTLEGWSRLEWKGDALREGSGNALPGALHVLTSQLKSDAALLPGQPATVYFYQASQWHALQVEKEPPSDGQKQKSKQDKGSTWKASVDWTGDFLGNAIASVRLVDGGIHMEMRHDGPHAYDILSEEIPRLEAALAQQGLDLKGWSYLHQARNQASPETSRLPVSPHSQQLDIRF